mmetsp:Transcript_52687/g.111936  ORF Transcript_52687/g.111936 Transcript_52687/m.111936 type:complete len:228 (+) Transcript_52687:176-859(+)|eukprot:CAMPEP_0172538820 /NCGR_PEP_ID=MMETSP1067-20121228/10134_1 /TAXON_ID=265564 ORGANISM="Thalassiosira punctigera, Strain Tpunct2005C2" /NCGR_SAMPLE_ID=MMETSP1067 /ASSEMBLY_ACC=CAM_ASM_000444 /LENGTH=227 /DNA_ID=CAMNT_0013324395 /DNA_START=174 /DNA_END=857 /DNA_ORIENTATION=+
MRLTTSSIVTASVLALSSLSNGASAALGKPHTIAEKEDNHKAAREKEFSDSSGGRKENLFASVLESDKCSPFVNKVQVSLDNILSSFDDDTIIDYLCNPIQMKQSQWFGGKVIDFVDQGTDENITCSFAFDKVLVETQSTWMEAFMSQDACKEEIVAELNFVHEERRRLASDSGRELIVPVIVFVGVGIVKIITNAGALVVTVGSLYKFMEREFDEDSDDDVYMWFN